MTHPGTAFAKGRVAAFLAILAVAALAGCGSSSDSSSGTAASTAASGSATPAGVQAAAAAIKPYLKPPTDIGVSAPLSKSSRGKRIAFMECAAPACKLLGDGLASAANSLGAKLIRVNAGQSPDTVFRAWNQILQNPPDAVIQGAFPPTLEMEQLKKMKAKHIPVLTAYSQEAPGLTTSVVGMPQFQTTGKALANYVISQSGGNANALIVTNNDIPGLVPQVKATQSTFAENCPSCKVNTLSVPLSGIGRTVPGQIVSYLQSHPKTDWIIFGTPDFVAGVPQAMNGASIKGVKAITQSESPLVFNYLKNHQLFVSDYGISLEFAAWRLVDAAARLMAGEKAPASSAMPAQFLTAKDMNFDLSKSWPSVPGYKEKFMKLWSSSS